MRRAFPIGPSTILLAVAYRLTRPDATVAARRSAARPDTFGRIGADLPQITIPVARATLGAPCDRSIRIRRQTGRHLTMSGG
jgi:hypothetical protein